MHELCRVAKHEQAGLGDELDASPALCAYPTSYISSTALASSRESFEVEARALAACSGSIGRFVRT